MVHRVSSVAAVLLVGAVWLVVAHDVEGGLPWIGLVAGLVLPLLLVVLLRGRVRPASGVAVALSTLTWAVVAWLWLAPVTVAGPPSLACGSALLPAEGVNAKAGTPCFLLLVDRFDAGAWPGVAASGLALLAWVLLLVDAGRSFVAAPGKPVAPSAVHPG